MENSEASAEVNNIDIEAHATDDKEHEVGIPRMNIYMTLGLLGVMTVGECPEPHCNHWHPLTNPA
jgi:hypothetical protein